MALRTVILFCQLENLVREMQDPEHGVPVRSQKLFLTSIPAAFMGKQPASAAGKCFLLRDVNLSISLIYEGQPLIKESKHPIIEHSAKMFYISRKNI